MNGARIVDLARQYLGVSELPPGSNRGWLPDSCLRFVGMALGNPWCAAFACWIASQSGVEDGPRSASTGGLYEWAKARAKVISAPAPGDIGLMLDRTSPTGFCHTVIVASAINRLGLIWTIEGNEGDRVARKLRLASKFKFIRPY